VDTGKLSVLVITPDGRLRAGLSVLLKSNHEIALVRQAADDETGRQLLLERQPDVIILDAGLPDGRAWPLLAYIKAVIPHGRCLLLVHSSPQKEQAKLAGADAILADDFTANNLFQTLKAIFPASPLSLKENIP